MTREQFKKLEVKDACVVKVGLDKGRVVIVMYVNKDDDIIVVRSADGKNFKAHLNEGRNHRLMNWRHLLILENLKGL